MKNSIITFEQLENLNENNPLIHNGMVITKRFPFDTYLYSIYKETDKELSDPDPIYETKSITELYNFLNK